MQKMKQKRAYQCKKKNDKRESGNVEHKTNMSPLMQNIQ